MKTKFLLTIIAFLLVLIAGLLAVIIIVNPLSPSAPQPAVVYSVPAYNKPGKKDNTLTENTIRETPREESNQQVVSIREEEKEKKIETEQLDKEYKKFAKYGIIPRQASYYENE